MSFSTPIITTDKYDRSHVLPGVSRRAGLCVALASALIALMFASSCSIEQLRAGASQAEDAVVQAGEQTAAAEAVVESLEQQIEAIDPTTPEAAEVLEELHAGLSEARDVLATWETKRAEAEATLARFNADLAEIDTGAEGAVVIGQAVAPLLPPPYGQLLTLGLGAAGAWFQAKKSGASRVARGVESARDREKERQLNVTAKSAEGDQADEFIVVRKRKAAAAHEALGVSRDVQMGTL